MISGIFVWWKEFCSIFKFNSKTGTVKNITLFSLLLCIFSGLSGQPRNINFYLQEAKKNSPLIHKSKNDKAIANLDLQQIHSILSKPEINIQSAVLFAPIVSHNNPGNRLEWVSKGATDYSGYDLALTEGGQYQAVISLRQSLWKGNQYSTYAHKTEIADQINDNDISLTIHELEQVIGYQYLLCIRSKIGADNSRVLLEQMEMQLKTLEKLVAHAIYKQTDYMLMKIEVGDLYGEYKMNQAEYRTNLYDLNLLCGINDTTLVELQDLNLTLMPGITAPSRFLTSYLLDSMDITADQVIFELKYKPQLDWFAETGLNAVYAPAFNRLGFSTGLTLSWKIFDGRQKALQREKTAIQLQTIGFEKKNFLTRNETGKNKLLNQIADLDQRILFAEQQSSYYQDIYQAYSKELPLGETSVMDFKNLMKDMASKKQSIIQMKMEKQLLINAYNYLNY
jgi:hypothetical protein